MAGKIFINYRRDDSMSTAGRLHDRLAQTFGRKNLFMDVDHVPAGVDFVDYLHKQVAACDVFLATIGPNWLDAKDDSGRRRFDNSDDFVAIEIAAALARNIRVIPVLVDGARTPKADKLPDSIKPLVRRNAVEVRNTHFGRDADALIERIREALSDKPVRVGRWRAAAGVVVIALLFVGWIGLLATGTPISLPWAVQPDTREQAEKERLAATAEEEKAKAAAEAEAKRKSEEAERQRSEEERRKQAEAEARARYSALVNQSYTDISNGDYDKAIAAASEAMRLDPKDAIPVVNRGLAYSRKGDVERAIADYTEAIRLNPNYARAFNDRGFDYAKKGENDRAVADYTEAIRLNPNYVMALNNRGNAYSKKGDNDRAIADYTEVIRLNPNNAMAFFNRANAYKKKGDNERAIADYTEVIRLNPNDAHAFNNRGFRYFKKGDNHRAIADYNETIRLDPKHALAFCNRGKAKLKIHERSGKADIAKARELNASICQ